MTFVGTFYCMLTTLQETKTFQDDNENSRPHNTDVFNEIGV